MIVYFLRHANAGQKRQSPVQDERRPLDKEGIEQCRWVGRLLNTLDVHVDLIFSSPLKRATQTASMVGNEIAYENRIERTPALHPAAHRATRPTVAPPAVPPWAVRPLAAWGSSASHPTAPSSR